MKRSIAVALATGVWLLALHPTANGAVGRTDGVASVSPAGGANYTIPIWAPAGAAGLKPTLALSYSHEIENGLLGVGFQLTGFPTISRCNKTRAQDNQSLSPSLSASDAYCLDGVRLRRTGGTAYGQDGSEYDTEIRTYAKITAKGSTGGGPVWWEIRTKDGLIYEYGNSVNSRLLSAVFGTVRTWGISSVRDRSGNVMQFQWTNAIVNLAVVYRPDEITWSTNAAASLTAAPYRAKLIYDESGRPDPLTFYNVGALGSETARLNRLEIQHRPEGASEFAPIRQYRLTYDASTVTNRSRITQVRECAASESDCLSPTTINYQTSAAGWSGTEQSTSHSSQEPQDIVLVDINGDGRDDVVYPDWFGDIYYKLVDSAGVFGPALPAPVDLTTLTQFPEPRLQPLRWNADAYPDVAVFYMQVSGGPPEYIFTPAFGVLIGGPSGFTWQDLGAITFFGERHLFADIDADGLDDLLVAQGNGSQLQGNVVVARNLGGALAAPQVYWSPPPGQSAYELAPPERRFQVTNRRGDANGDGAADLVALVCYGDPCSTYSAWQLLLSGSSPSASLRFASASTPQMADINGDGLMDIVNNNGYLLSTGTDLTGSVIVGPSVAPFSYPSGVVNAASIRVFDWDQDGRDDLLFPSGSTWSVARSTGSEFAVATQATAVPYVSGDSYFPGDINGDGRMDVFQASSTTLRYRSHVATNAPDLVSQVSDGFNFSSEFVYAPLTDTTVYTPGTGVTLPQVVLRSARPVVRQMRQTDGSGNATYTETFQYEDGRVDLHGRGSLGFRKRVSTNSANGYNIRTEETYRQDFPFIGLIDNVVQKQSSGATFREQVNVWAALSTGDPFVDQRQFPYVATETTREYEVGGARNGTQLRTVVTTRVAPDGVSGTVTDQTTTVREHANANGLNPDQLFTTRTLIPSGSLLNDVSRWCVGRSQRTEVTTSYDGGVTGAYGAAQTRRTDTAWDPDPTQCRPRTVTAFPGDPALQVTTVLDYDPSGNVETETTTPIGIPPRVTTYSFGTDGLRLRSMTNPAGHVTDLVWDFTRDVVSSSEDPNNAVTVWTHDSFSRELSMTRPDGTRRETAYLDCIGAPFGCLPETRMVVRSTEMNNATPGVTINESFVYLNKVGQAIRTQRQMQGGALSRVDIEYDPLGRVSRESVPCWATSCAHQWTSFSYDLLDRRIGTSRPRSDSDATAVTTSVLPEGLTVRMLDELGREKRVISNARGEVVRVIDAYGSAVAATASYGWDAFGNLKRSQAPDNTNIDHTYNIRGFRTQTIDPNMGTWDLEYWSTGQLRRLRDAKTASPAWTSEYQYDALDRLVQRTDVPENAVTTWTYDGATASCVEGEAGGASVGRLQSVSLAENGVEKYRDSYCFDPIGRLSSHGIRMPQDTGGTSWNYAWTYNAEGRVHLLRYPQLSPTVRLTVRHQYDHGVLKQLLLDSAYPELIWESSGRNARGQVTSRKSIAWATAGCLYCFDETTAFDSVTGRIKSRGNSFVGAYDYEGFPIDNGDYTGYLWRDDGSMYERVRGEFERYTYDGLSRLTMVERGQVASALSTVLSVGYDNVGRITSKSDVGGTSQAYAYGDSNHPHAVTQAGPNQYTFDANGNLVTRNGDAIDWTSFNLPKLIRHQSTAGLSSSTFAYGPDRQYFKQDYVDSQRPLESTQVLYLGGLMQRRAEYGSTRYDFQVVAEGSVVATVMGYGWTWGPSIGGARWHSDDALGSVNTICSGGWQQCVYYGSSAFGTRTAREWSQPPNPNWDQWDFPYVDRRGYTGHEHLDNLNLIHMGGRVYAPVVGKFLSPDPTIPDLYNTQALNRYSYVYNNPTSRTDPSGFTPGECEGGSSWSCGPIRITIGTWQSSWWSDYFYIQAQILAQALVLGDRYLSNVPAQTMNINSSATAPMVRSGSSPHANAAQQSNEYNDEMYRCHQDGGIGCEFTASVNEQVRRGDMSAEEGRRVVSDHYRELGRAAFDDLRPDPLAKIGKVLGIIKKTRAARGLSHWGNPRTLARHFRDHGADFGAKSADDYARQASDFFRRSQADRLPTKVDADGVIRVYDPRTNTFGSFNPDGTTRTFFKPTSPTYFDRQPGSAPWGP